MFGKARLQEALFEAKIENAKLELLLEGARENATRSAADAANWTSQTFKLTAERDELKLKNAVLLERLDLLANHLPPAPTQSFNTLSEEAEDADYALHAGLIDRDAYEAILASAGALNTEITFDSDSPRL